ncbi:MAG: TIGR00304 family membrane protein [Pyrobaculum sp.]
MLELILLGIVLIILGMFILMLSLWRAGEGRGEAGGVVIVGPVPIVFGTSQRVAATVMVLAIVLTVVTLLLFLLGLALVR